jgi:Gluconate 2-dehydrogenase subunit 3
MERREAVQYIALLLGGTLVGANSFITGCKTADKKDNTVFTQEDVAYLNEVADTILPTTPSSPGAKAANVGQFMTVMVNDCYEEKDQKIFHEGMNKLNDAAEKNYNAAFMKLNPQQRHDLLVKLDTEQKDYTGKKKKEDPSHYFRMMKELTLLGYFTSEIGTTQARRYAPVPGRYEGCVPYKKGEKAWA